jgi:hypothetical protein
MPEVTLLLRQKIARLAGDERGDPATRVVARAKLEGGNVMLVRVLTREDHSRNDLPFENMRFDAVIPVRRAHGVGWRWSPADQEPIRIAVGLAIIGMIYARQFRRMRRVRQDWFWFTRPACESKDNALLPHLTRDRSYWESR